MVIMAKTKRKKEMFGSEEIEVIYRETKRPAPVEVRKSTKESMDGLEEKSLEGGRIWHKGEQLRVLVS
jgi:hypothetical protein